MSTVRSLIQTSFEILRIYAPGEEVTPADLARGFSEINDMLDSWSGESMTLFCIKESSVQFTPGTWQYTIGVGGDIDETRPISIINGYGAAYVVDDTSNRYPLTVLNQAQWNQIGNILEVNANIPQYIFYDPQFPLGILNFYPIPNIGWTAYFDSRAQLLQFDTIDDQVSFPPGYNRALSTNLAIWLAQFYETAIVTPALVKTAAEAKGNIKRSNNKVPVAQYESEIVSRARATYNIYRDT